MIIEQLHYSTRKGWVFFSEDQEMKESADLVLAFGGREALAATEWLADLQFRYPNAHILSASTSGEIIGEEVHDDSIACTAIHFERTKFQVAQVSIDELGSKEVVCKLATMLPLDGLRHVFVVSDGLHINGTDLIAGLNSVLPDSVSITGGLAGDGAFFQQTLVGLNDRPKAKQIAAIGFYGESLKVGYGSVGGWDAFGPDRIITKSEANVLYELDGRPALELYKLYLGEKASELPASALLFPLCLRKSLDDKDEVVRTVLSVDEEKQSMTFAGDIPLGNVARLMKANFERLIDGAQAAAEQSASRIGGFEPELALLVSCVGRKLVLGQRIEDEVESVRDIVGENAFITGFYSYGELAPGNNRFDCRLHNQTMTITLLKE